MARLKRTEDVETEVDLICTICWDDNEDPVNALAPGVYATCCGEWRREDDGRWRFWVDPIAAVELGINVR